MKTSKLITLAITLVIFLFPQVHTQAQPVDSIPLFAPQQDVEADDTLLVQIYVEKGAYNTGEDVTFSALLSMNGYPIAGMGMCASLYSQAGDLLWGVCGYTGEDGYYSETMTYGFVIPADYVGTLRLTVTDPKDNGHYLLSQDCFMFVPARPPAQVLVETGFQQPLLARMTTADGKGKLIVTQLLFGRRLPHNSPSYDPAAERFFIRLLGL